MLNEIKWVEKYRLGIPEIDAQHFELIKRVNNLVFAFVSEKSKNDIRDISAFLQAYVAIHFHDEEALMAKYGYAEMKNHQSIHAEYTRRVESLIAEIQGNAITPALMSEMNELLIQWITKHIDIEDRRFAESILKR
jgi:hemerythrin